MTNEKLGGNPTRVELVPTRLYNMVPTRALLCPASSVILVASRATNHLCCLKNIGLIAFS